MAITTLKKGLPKWAGGTDDNPPEFEITYEGAVLAEYERNGYDDSDFYAIVWDEAEQSPKHIMWGTTRGWTYANGCTVDATEEVKAKAAEHNRKARVRNIIINAEQAAASPAVGKTVEVVKGRKIPKGTVAEVVWEGPDKFSYSRYSQTYLGRRVGLNIDGQRVFTNADNVRVVNPEQYHISEAKAIEMAGLARTDGPWRIAVQVGNLILG